MIASVITRLAEMQNYKLKSRNKNILQKNICTRVVKLFKVIGKYLRIPNNYDSVDSPSILYNLVH